MSITVYLTGLTVFALFYWARDEFLYFSSANAAEAFILSLVWPFILVLAVFSRIRKKFL